MNQELFLPSKEDQFDFWKFLHWLILVPGFAFIWHLVELIREHGEKEALVIFREVRDKIYLGFVGIFLVFGFLILLRGKGIGGAGRQTHHKILSILSTALILATFSYKIALFVIDILRLLNLL